MNKIKTLLIIITVTFAMMLGISGCGDSDYDPDTNMLKAVPRESAIIIKTTEFSSLINSLNKQNFMWSQLRQLTSLKTSDAIIKLTDTIIKQNSELRGFVNMREIVISFQKQGHEVECLLSATANKTEAQRIAGVIKKVASSKGYELKTGNYDNTTLFRVVDKQDPNKVKLVFSYVNSEEIFVVSTSQILVESSVRHVKCGDGSIGSDRLLKRLVKTHKSSSSSVMIVNYRNLADMLKFQIASSASYLKSIETYADWAVLDIKPDYKEITLTGYTDYKDNGDAYLKMYVSQQPVANDFVNYLPSKTTNFVSIGISDMSAFKSDYSDYLDYAKLQNQYKKNNSVVSKTFGVNFEEKIYGFMGKRIIEFTSDYSLAARSSDNYIVAELDNEDAAEKFLVNAVKKYQQKNNKSDKEMFHDIVSNTNKKFVAYFCPIKKLMSIYFGDIFTNEYSYFTIYKDKLVFGQNISGLREYINAVETRKVLSENTNYADFTELVNKSSNIYYYIDLPYSKSKIAAVLSKNNAREYNQFFTRLQDFRSLALIYSNTGDEMFFTNAALKYSQIIEAERYVSWITPVDTTVKIKPQLVKNHLTNGKDIICQDERCKLHFISKDGTKYWSKQMPEPLKGQVYEVDLFQNGKIQYLFATGNELHLIDRNGNYVENFPVKLPAPLATEISVFDYAKDGNYRIFVPCSNQRIYVYTKDGSQLESWNPVETDNKIVTPVQYFNINDDEYLVFADRLKTYILSRNGSTKIAVTTNFPKAPNTKFYVEAPGGISNLRFVTTNSSGQVQYITRNGSVHTQNFRDYFSANHNFILADINGDGENEYIFTDNRELVVYKSSGGQLFNYYFDGLITGKPNIFRFAVNDVRIGVVCADLNKIYLFDKDGKICSGFPLEGTTEFSIGVLNHPNKYSVVCGGRENFLYNYLIQ